MKRVVTRQRQINIGKDTPEYQWYTQELPASRRDHQHPFTPDPNARISKRAFDKRLSQWRRDLHEFGEHDRDAFALRRSRMSFSPKVDVLSPGQASTRADSEETYVQAPTLVAAKRQDNSPRVCQRPSEVAPTTPTKTQGCNGPQGSPGKLSGTPNQRVMTPVCRTYFDWQNGTPSPDSYHAAQERFAAEAHHHHIDARSRSAQHCLGHPMTLVHRPFFPGAVQAGQSQGSAWGMAEGCGPVLQWVPSPGFFPLCRPGPHIVTPLSVPPLPLGSPPSHFGLTPGSGQFRVHAVGPPVLGYNHYTTNCLAAWRRGED